MSDGDHHEPDGLFMADTPTVRVSGFKVFSGRIVTDNRLPNFFEARALQLLLQRGILSFPRSTFVFWNIFNGTHSIAFRIPIKFLFIYTKYLFEEIGVIFKPPALRSSLPSELCPNLSHLCQRHRLFWSLFSQLRNKPDVGNVSFTSVVTSFTLKTP